MPRLRTVKAVGLIALQVFLSGCAARSQLVSVQPVVTDLGTYSSVVLWVQSGVADDVEQEMSDLEGLTLSRIKALNLVEDVQLGEGIGGQPGTLIVKATISEMKKVSGTRRVLLGAFAGRASMTTEILLVDAATGKTLGSFSVTGQSGGAGVSGGTSDAVQKAAQGIADIIAQNYKR
jgi:hypothetical protein